MHDIAVMAPLTGPPQSLPDPAPGSGTACRDWPLRPLKLFHEPTGEKLELVQSLKRRERHLGAGDTWKGDRLFKRFFLPEGNLNAAAQERNAAREGLEPVFGDRL
jgi:hypothetical protein